MSKKFQQNTSSTYDKKMLVMKKHAMLNAGNVKTVPKMLTIPSAEMIIRYYLPIRLDVVAKTVLKALILKTDPTDKFKHQQHPEYVYKVKDRDFWWKLTITTATKLKHNKPNIVLWDRPEKICKITEISCSAGVNITKKIWEKLHNYGLLIRNLQIMYPHYKF